jgi:hypothetical protein
MRLFPQVFNSTQHNVLRRCREVFDHTLYVNPLDFGAKTELVPIQCDNRTHTRDVYMIAHWGSLFRRHEGIMKITYEIQTKCGLP